MFDNKKIFSVAWPLGMNAVLLQGILIIDTLLVTPLGENALAAMGLAAGIAGIMIGIIFAFSNGSQMLLAQAFGAQNPVAMKSGFWSGLIINGIIALIALLCLYIIIPFLLPILAATPEVQALAAAYLYPFGLVFIALAAAQNFTAFFNACGDTTIPFYSNLLELPLNAGLSFIFIYGYWGSPAMGLAGAALGTVLAVLIRAIFLWLYFKKKLLRSINIAGWSKDNLTSTVKNHFRESAPIANIYITMTLSINVCLLIYAQLPVYAFASLTLLFPWIKVAGHLVTAWAQASGILIGQMIGKKQFDLLDDMVSRSWRVALCISLLVALFYFSLSFLFGYIYPNLQQNTQDVLWDIMPLLLVLPFIRSSNTHCGHILRAGGDSKYVFKIHFFTQWFFTVPLSAFLVLYLQVSVFWVFAIILMEETIKGIPFHLRVHSGRWKNNLEL